MAFYEIGHIYCLIQRNSATRSSLQPQSPSFSVSKEIHRGTDPVNKLLRVN